MSEYFWIGILVASIISFLVGFYASESSRDKKSRERRERERQSKKENDREDLERGLRETWKLLGFRQGEWVEGMPWDSREWSPASALALEEIEARLSAIETKLKIKKESK